MKRVVVGCLVAGLVLSAAPAGAQDTGEGGDLYDQSCASCHQAGGAGIEGSFPPLAGNPNAADGAYVASVIRNGLSGPIEVNGITYDGQMPAISQLDDGQVDAVVAYVATLAGGTTPATTAPVAAPAVAGDAAAGRALFVGAARLANGGPSCMACHAAGSESNLGGPNLGPDLTDVYDRFGGEAGLAAALANPPSPTMTPLFEGRPLAEDEVADLVAYFADVRSEVPRTGVDLLLVAGLAGLGVLLVFMALVLRGPRRSYTEQLRSAR